MIGRKTKTNKKYLKYFDQNKWITIMKKKTLSKDDEEYRLFCEISDNFAIDRSEFI